MATYRDGNKQVAYRNGVLQAAYRNGVKVMGGAGRYTLSSNTTSTISGFLKGVVGAIDPNIFEGSEITLCSTNPPQVNPTILGITPAVGDGVISLTRLDTDTVYLLSLLNLEAVTDALIFTPADDFTDIQLFIERVPDATHVITVGINATNSGYDNGIIAVYGTMGRPTFEGSDLNQLTSNSSLGLTSININNPALVAGTLRVTRLDTMATIDIVFNGTTGSIANQLFTPADNGVEIALNIERIA